MHDVRSARCKGHIEQQAKDSDQEQKRLSSLETAAWAKAAMSCAWLALAKRIASEVLQKREAGSEALEMSKSRSSHEDSIFFKFLERTVTKSNGDLAPTPLSDRNLCC